ncbi:hypothetical protein ACFL5U_02815 [Candidatus Margulisiibacteriota bacterium]
MEASICADICVPMSRMGEKVLSIRPQIFRPPEDGAAEEAREGIIAVIYQDNRGSPQALEIQVIDPVSNKVVEEYMITRGPDYVMQYDESGRITGSFASQDLRPRDKGPEEERVMRLMNQCRVLNGGCFLRNEDSEGQIYDLPLSTREPEIGKAMGALYQIANNALSGSLPEHFVVDASVAETKHHTGQQTWREYKIRFDVKKAPRDIKSVTVTVLNGITWYLQRTYVEINEDGDASRHFTIGTKKDVSGALDKKPTLVLLTFYGTSSEELGRIKIVVQPRR